MTVESLGIKKVESVNWYVHDMERTRHFYTKLLDFSEIAQSTPDIEARGKQRSVVFRAGDITLNCIQPIGEGGRAHRWLQKHPDGVGTINYEVEDIEKTFRLLEARGGTIIDDEIRRFTDSKGGTLAFFSITTPFGNTTFRFVQRDGYSAIYPGVEMYAQPKGGSNKFNLRKVDHITSNFRTLRAHGLVVQTRDGLRRVLEHSIPHQRRNREGQPARLWFEIDRDVGPVQRREVRQQ